MKHFVEHLQLDFQNDRQPRMIEYLCLKICQFLKFKENCSCLGWTLIIGLIFWSRGFETNRVTINFRITCNIGPISQFYKLIYSHFSTWLKGELAFLIHCNQFSDNVQYCLGLNIEAEEVGSKLDAAAAHLQGQSYAPPANLYLLIENDTFTHLNGHSYAPPTNLYSSS